MKRVIDKKTRRQSFSCHSLYSPKLAKKTHLLKISREESPENPESNLPRILTPCGESLPVPAADRRLKSQREHRV